MMNFRGSILVFCLLMSYLSVNADENGRMSTYGDSDFTGVNGIMETYYKEDLPSNEDYNGVRTEIEPQDAQSARGFNGAMDIFDSNTGAIANNELIKPIIDAPAMKMELYFPVNQFSIYSYNQEDAQKILTFLKNGNIDKIGIWGYADPTGSKDYNQKLSQKRADEFKKWLVAHGISSSIIIATGKGIDAEQEDYQKARRVEIILTLRK
ncbi:MAG: OmpA family protein [Chitinophagales bacterium]|nr:OmpA family protein [Chitinophagales bacterium]